MRFELIVAVTARQPFNKRRPFLIERDFEYPFF